MKEGNNKKILSLFILAMTTTIIMTTIMTDYFVEKRIKENNQEMISLMNELIKNNNETMNELITNNNELIRNLSEAKKIIITNNNDDNQSLIEIINQVYASNERLINEWQEQQRKLLIDAYEKGRNSKKTRIIYINNGY